jgi:hypothetical protein
MLEESCFTSPKEITSVLTTESDAACSLFNHQGLVHYEFTLKGQTINQDFYPTVLRYLQDAAQRK